MNLERGAKLFLKVERLAAAGSADDDVEPSPARLFEGRKQRRGITMNVNVGVDPLESRHIRGLDCRQ